MIHKPLILLCVKFLLKYEFRKSKLIYQYKDSNYKDYLKVFLEASESLYQPNKLKFIFPKPLYPMQSFQLHNAKHQQQKHKVNNLHFQVFPKKLHHLDLLHLLNLS